MSTVTLSQSAALARRSAALPVELRRVLADIAGPLRASEGAPVRHLDVCRGLVALAEVAKTGGQLRDLTVSALRMITTPTGATLADVIAGLDEAQACGFRGVAEIASAVRT